MQDIFIVPGFLYFVRLNNIVYLCTDFLERVSGKRNKGNRDRQIEGAKVPSFIRKMVTKEEIEEIVNAYLEGTDKFLISTKVSKNGLVEVFIDGDRDIAIEDCVVLSRHIETFFDRDVDNFELRVSSAGIDKPFTSIRQYRKYLNRPVEVVTNEGVKYQGMLAAVDDHGVELIPVVKAKKSKQDDRLVLAYKDISNARPGIVF